MEKIIQRINELARKNKSEGLSPAEMAEREQLRKQYLENFRANFRQELDRIEFTDEKPTTYH